MNYLLIVNGSDAEINRRFHERIWSLYNEIAHAKELKKDDNMVIYRGSSHARHFIDDAKIKSMIIEDSRYIQLDNTSLWKKPVMIADITHKLSTIKKLKYCGACLVSRIKRLDQKYFKCVMPNTKNIVEQTL